MKNYDFSLYGLYRSLGIYADNLDSIQKYINGVITSKIGINTKKRFYDSTNYYFLKNYEGDDEYEVVIPLITDKKEIKKQKLLEAIDKNGDKITRK